MVRTPHGPCVVTKRANKDSDRNDTPNAEPGTISRAEFIEEIRDLLTMTKGRVLPGMFNPLIVGERPWEALAWQHVGNTWDAARLFLDLLLSDLTDEAITGVLFHHVTDLLMKRKLNSSLRSSIKY